MNPIALWLPVIALFQASAPPKLTVQLYAEADSIPPGGQTDLAIEINVEKGWHIYHPIVLDTGAPPTIGFTLPPGATVGELRFPTPTLGEQADLEYLALEGQVVVLTTLHVAADAAPGPLSIQVHVRALACKQLCVPVQTAARLTLNVSTQPPAAANAKLFAEARADLPAPLERAKYIDGSRISVVPEKVDLEQGAEVVLTVRVRKGHHIQDQDPGAEGLIPSRLFIEPLDGIRFDEQKWPAPQIRTIEGFGKVRQQGGEFTVRVPFTLIDSEFPSGPVALRALFTYQCCTDAGLCYPPEAAEAAVRFVAVTPNKPPADGRPLGTLMPLLTGAEAAPPATQTPSPDNGAAPNLLYMLVLSFLGGLILNVMPCVFPVISIKVLGFVKQAGEDRGRVLRLGLAFCAGIMVWFWIFGAVAAYGNMPLQSPQVVIALGTIMFVFSLSLFGVFEIVLPGAAAGGLDAAARREGYTGAFLKGLLATLLGTACTAPFLGFALGYALTQAWWVGLAIFTAAGVGMSSPYLLLSAKPAWLKYIPKPGPWMMTFKQAMGFVLVATAVWLLWILGRQIGADGVVWTVCFWGFLGLAAWMLGKIRPTWHAGSRATMWTASVLVALLGFYFCYFVMYDWNAA
ncbi:MAG: hypothetical protein KKI02_10890 [Planctomycetes bacterium]|nr:hypothetical protein [Planctomycetota bacterium]